jgi:hypothetical protein
MHIFAELLPFNYFQKYASEFRICEEESIF